MTMKLVKLSENQQSVIRTKLYKLLVSFDFNRIKNDNFYRDNVWRDTKRVKLVATCPVSIQDICNYFYTYLSKVNQSNNVWKINPQFQAFLSLWKGDVLLAPPNQNYENAEYGYQVYMKGDRVTVYDIYNGWEVDTTLEQFIVEELFPVLTVELEDCKDAYKRMQRGD